MIARIDYLANLEHPADQCAPDLAVTVAEIAAISLDVDFEISLVAA